MTLGDAAGISPEIIIKTLSEEEVYKQVRPVVIGDTRVIKQALEITGKSLKIHPIKEVSEAQFEFGTIDIVDMENLSPENFKLGTVSAYCGNAAVEYIRKSAELALAGEIDAVASAPTNKESFNKAGHHYAGQTEIYAEATNTTDFFTILTGGMLRVYLLSSHTSLRQAIDLVKQERVEKVIRMAHSSLQSIFGIDRPTIAVPGLNPHAGDGGLFGQEEIEEITPVIERLKEEGIDVTGPYPSDSLYYSAEQGKYDGIIGMYHDQGVIPLKRYGYVTVIVGTPIIRTTAGHGTAYDIAGKGIANHDVFKRAALLAAELVEIKRSRSNK